MAAQYRWCIHCCSLAWWNYIPLSQIFPPPNYPTFNGSVFYDPSCWDGVFLWPPIWGLCVLNKPPSMVYVTVEGINNGHLLNGHCLMILNSVLVWSVKDLSQFMWKMISIFAGKLLLPYQINLSKPCTPISIQTIAHINK